MKIEDKIPYADKVMNFIVGFVLMYFFLPVLGLWMSAFFIFVISVSKELWWDRNYDVDNVDAWDFVAVIFGAVLSYFVF